MKPHAFIAMPFGRKPGPDGQLIDFNLIYKEYIKPALEEAGLEVFRADEEQRAGDIITDMFQELLIADLVVADLTIDNPNVWYELGVRHALRARGIILICGGRTPTAFDLYTQRKLRYRDKEASPFERCNLWLLYTALACGVDKVRFICLWDGSGGDGPGGTAHMYNAINQLSFVSYCNHLPYTLLAYGFFRFLRRPLIQNSRGGQELCSPRVSMMRLPRIPDRLDAAK